MDQRLVDDASETPQAVAENRHAERERNAKDGERPDELIERALERMRPKCLWKQQRERHWPNPVEEEVKHDEEGQPLDLLPFRQRGPAPIAIDHGPGQAGKESQENQPTNRPQW